MSEKIIRIKSGNEEFTMNVTEEEYLKYYRPWWQMKKREQRNREAMELNGYTEESYEERGNLKRQDANEISAIMANIEGWKKADNKVRFPIYGIVRGYCRDHDAKAKNGNP